MSRSARLLDLVQILRRHRRPVSRQALAGELRQDFRHFRIDRMSTLEIRPERTPRWRRVLMKEWRAQEGVPKEL